MNNKKKIGHWYTYFKDMSNKDKTWEDMKKDMTDIMKALEDMGNMNLCFSIKIIIVQH